MRYEYYKIFKGVFLLFMVMGLCVFWGCATGSTPNGKAAAGAVAVWDLENMSIPGAAGPGVDLNDLGEILSAKIIEGLNEKGDRTIVERERLLLALEELGLGTNELADESTRLKIGKIVGAQLMVLGGYMVIGDQMRIDLRLVEVETGKILNATEKTVPAATLQGCLNAARDAAAALF